LGCENPQAAPIIIGIRREIKTKKEKLNNNRERTITKNLHAIDP
jgi:hypothetical protein